LAKQNSVQLALALSETFTESGLSGKASHVIKNGQHRTLDISLTVSAVGFI